MLSLLETLVFSGHLISNLIEENVKGLVKGGIKLHLVSIFDHLVLVLRRAHSGIFGSSGEIGSRHHN
jgi:hypothetical protein